MLNPTLTLDTTEASSALDEVRLRPLTRSVTLTWKNGYGSTHEVRRRDMLRLLNPRLSFGTWANRFVLG